MGKNKKRGKQTVRETQREREREGLSLDFMFCFNPFIYHSTYNNITILSLYASACITDVPRWYYHRSALESKYRFSTVAEPESRNIYILSKQTWRKLVNGCR